MAYCEQCGQLLKPGIRFCEFCGAPVMSVASSGGTRCRPDADDQAECGLIVTCLAALCDQLSATPRQVSELVSRFCADSLSRGVRYEFCDLGAVGDPDGRVLSYLRGEILRHRVKYLFILGNEEVVDVIRWKNEAGDSDAEVESDLCYATLDTASPWAGVRYDFDAMLRVGRLPTYDGESFAAFARYFANVSAASGSCGAPLPYGLSALTWQDESNDVFSRIAPTRVEVSPSVTRVTASSSLAYRPNLLYFNLHGSDRAPFWYGQCGSSYPEAFSPQLMASLGRPFCVGTEACYGARYLDGLTPDESALLAAMTGSCLAFLGSSRIAYGTSRPSGSCADIVVGEFVRGVHAGWSAGDAYVEGLRCLCRNGNLDDTDLKTLAEFALYGDPSVRFGSGAKRTFAKSASLGRMIAMPDVRLAVRMALAACDARIERTVDDLVSRQFAAWTGGAPLSAFRQKMYRLSSLGLNQKLYMADDGRFRRSLKVYFDDGGNVRKALESK